jgi:HPt (histidine-containing phosphotransfer) domain-containing protein
MGLLLGAMSLQYLENFFGSTSLALDTSISLVREDGTLLARFPHTDEVGKPSSGGGQRALALPPDVPTNSVAALDREAFEELVREIGGQAASEIRAVFTEETEIRMNLLRKLSLDRDMTGIGREAHSLKSSAGTFGYRELASLAEELELGARWLADGEYREPLDRTDVTYSSTRAEKLQR